MEWETVVTGKPSYILPTMKEINAIPWNGLTVISTFSGCGGSSLGYKAAGFRVVWANEFIPAAQETYAANFPQTILDKSDIRNIQPEAVLKAIGMASGEIDILDGSPPCASFSTSGKREASWGNVKKYSDTTQRTDDLFFEYARLVDGLQPKVFVAENVSGLIKGTAKGYFKIILARLKECGYNVRAKVLDAKWLGVPQSRKRVIFVGVRNDIDKAPAFPVPLCYYLSLRDAIAQCGEPVEAESDIARYAIGKEWRKLVPGQKSAKYLNLKRTSMDKPCPTVTQTGNNRGAACVLHPLECRRFSIGELKRICGFPNDFVLTGTYSQQWERLGRAVPPPMMAAIATAIRNKVFDT